MARGEKEEGDGRARFSEILLLQNIHLQIQEPHTVWAILNTGPKIRTGPNKYVGPDFYPDFSVWSVRRIFWNVPADL